MTDEDIGEIVGNDFLSGLSELDSNEPASGDIGVTTEVKIEAKEEVMQWWAVKEEVKDDVKEEKNECQFISGI